MRSKAVSDQALGVLGDVQIEDGRLLKLPARQLERGLYTEVDKVLKALGGKWDRYKRGHVFADDPTDLLDQILVSGRFVDRKQALGFFATPPELAQRVVAAADVQPGHRVLEPSAGTGALLACLPRVRLQAIEIDEGHAAALRAVVEATQTDYMLCYEDFLQEVPSFRGVDRVVMNPPFARQADIAHVSHALTFLAPGGRLVAIMSAGITYRQDSRTKAFYELLQRATDYKIEPLPEGSFRSSGTDVRTILLTVDW